MKKRFVFEFAPKGFVCVDGKYALVSEPIAVVSPYDANEKAFTALAVDMSEKIVDGRWSVNHHRPYCNVYRIYWFDGDEFKNPSIIGDEKIMVEISPKIFAKRVG